MLIIPESIIPKITPLEYQELDKVLWEAENNYFSKDQVKICKPELIALINKIKYDAFKEGYTQGSLLK